MTKKNLNKNEKVNVVINNSAKDIIAKFAESTKGLLSTNLGTKKSSIYKENLFAGCTDKEKKSLRKKFRNMLFSNAKALISESNKENKEKLIKSFNDFYLSAYKVNDYTLQSVCNENLSKEKKDVLLKALDLCKK